MDKTESPADDERTAARGLCAKTRETGRTSRHTTSSVPNDTATGAPPGYSSFLDMLSPELRNQIYEEVLIDPTRIHIDDALRPPALLAVNRQIRSETHRMWYSQNDSIAADIRLLLKWNMHRLHAPCALTFVEFGGVCNWAHLMYWCWAVQQDVVDAMDIADPADPYMHVIATSCKVAASHNSGGSWHKCKEALTALRSVSGLLDAQWLEGGDGFDQCK